MDLQKACQLTAALVPCVISACAAQQVETGLLRIGGFRCVELKPLRNDSTFDLCRTGGFSYASFRMDVLKRNGVPFWYPAGTGDIRVAGAEWRPAMYAVASDSSAGGSAGADRQEPGNGEIRAVNDGDESTYWYAGEGSSAGRVWIDLPRPVTVTSVRFLGWATGRHAPKDYAIGVILPNGERQQLAAVRDEKRLGEWISFPVDRVEIRGVYLDVFSTVEGEFGPVVYELQAQTDQPATGPAYPSELAIPLGGTAAEEFFCLGNVGAGFAASPAVETPVGEYVFRYQGGQEEVVPLIAGRNVADLRYGHFVPGATFAFSAKGRAPAGEAGQGGLSYHLDEMLPVEPKTQVLLFSHRLAHPDWPLESLRFRCTQSKASLLLAAVTLRASGPRLNALVYNGKMVKPYPRNTPRAKPSPLEARRDPSRALTLDGTWQYVTDPGNQGIDRGYFRADYDSTDWERMPVPSQWYVQGLDYHGVVWFRREVEVPAAFPGSVLELEFGAVDYDARVWVNGQLVGRHIGAYAAFAVDVSKAIRKGMRNLVVVRVDSPVDPGYGFAKTLIKGNSMDDIAMPYNDEGCMGGIFRPVTLTGRGDVGIEDAWASSTIATDLGHADVSVRLALKPADGFADTVQVKCRLIEPKADGRKPRVFAAEQTVSPNGTTPLEFVFGIPDPMLWYPWEQGRQDLHTLEIEVVRGEEVMDRHLARVGVRTVAFNEQEQCVYVNHHRIFIKGMLNDDIHWMSMMDRTGYRQRVQLQKDANLNLIRMVGHQSSPHLYDLCDELGMLIWQEMPLQWGYSSSEPVRADILDVVRETVTQCRPHASVIGWSAWNEGGQPGFSERITAAIRQLDGTRPLSRASGGGDFDIHIYPNITPAQLSRRTFFWTDIRLGFVSEVGAYGLSSLPEMKEMVGSDLFPFDSADYFWETFNSYRCNDGPVFWDAPAAADWPTAKVREYVLGKLEPSERWLVQFMKFMFENFRAQRFDPTTAAIHCRFDDALPTAYLGVVNFDGRPRKAYHAVREACQPVLPILFFDFRGARDLRVVNEYWNRAWQGCRLRYTLTTRDGREVCTLEKRFDLPADATVPVLTAAEVGDLYHLPGGFLAELTVTDRKGKLLSENHYDLTAEEIQAFVTSVYPVPPLEPLNAQVMAARTALVANGVARTLDAPDTYAKTLLELGGDDRQPYLKYAVSVPQDGDYLVRVACNSGQTLRSLDLLVGGQKAELENYPYTDMTLGMTRLPYSSFGLSWRPGWKVHLAQGEHSLEFRWPEGKPAPRFIVDAICLQLRD